MIVLAIILAYPQPGLLLTDLHTLPAREILLFKDEDPEKVGYLLKVTQQTLFEAGTELLWFLKIF